VGDKRTNYVVQQYKGNKLVPMRAWGGLLAENASQALSRDIFSDMMLRLEAKGIKIIFHVHDEFVIEVDEEKAEDTLNDVIEVMSTPPTWIPNLPLEAEGKIVNKYQK
jgi:DNA polymerase